MNFIINPNLKSFILTRTVDVFMMFPNRKHLRSFGLMYVNEKVKQLRLQKGLTLEKLASLAKITKGYLSKIENSDQSPPVSTLQTIAVALGVEVGDILEAESAAIGNIDIIQRADGKALVDVVSTAGYSYKRLVRSLKNKYMNPFLMKVNKGETELFSHDGEEFAFVVSGQVEFNYEKKTYICQEGDSFYFDARIPHKFINKQNKQAALITINFNYRRF
jgi:transcriptional regulator with XRE-family HTH domain